MPKINEFCLLKPERLLRFTRNDIFYAADLFMGRDNSLKYRINLLCIIAMWEETKSFIKL
jgi:hypothetical protein